jgi:hypothetical protein
MGLREALRRAPVRDGVRRRETALHPWEPVELVFRGSPTADPYGDVPPRPGADRLVGTFTAVDGPAAGQRLDLVGFWDGDRTWRIRFAAPAPGTWAWATRSPDRRLSGRHGRLVVVRWSDADLAANPTHRGAVRVRRDGCGAGRTFARADGSPFLWVGDTWWNWTKRGIDPESFRRLVADRAAKGFTLGQLFVPGNGWSPASQVLDAGFGAVDLEHLRRVEALVRMANAQGLAVWINPWWGREQLADAVDEARLARWWRFLVHRLSAFDVVWVVAAEYNAHDHGGLGLDAWRRLGALVRDEDPYRRAVGIHPTPPNWPGGTAAPQWSTGEVLHAEPWLDFHQIQAGHGRDANDRIPALVAADRRRTPPKPVVVTEPWYEFVPGDAPAAEIRFGIWAAVLSGAAGHSYGGGHVWRAHVPESPAAPDDWPLDPSFADDTLDYAGARAMAVMAEVLTGLAWWALEPRPDLLDGPEPLCAAGPEGVRLAYLRRGGVAAIDLTELADGPRRATAAWIDPATGAVARRDDVATGGPVRLDPPARPGRDDASDWLVLVTPA